MKTCSKCKVEKAVDEFYVQRKRKDGRNPQCKACCLAYREANRERERERMRAYYQENREKIAERDRRYYEANKDKIAAKRKVYYEENPHLWWLSNYKIVAKEAGLEPVVEEFTKADVIVLYGDACVYCGGGAFEHLDHYVPVSQGGPHTLENVRPSCAGCNIRKYSSLPEEWEQRKGGELVL